MLTLTPFRQLNGSFSEVNVSAPQPTMYEIESPERLKTCMARTGAGTSITSRELAAAAEVAHGTIGALMAGTQRLIPEHKAQAIADVLHVELAFLWIRMERDGRGYIPAQVAV